MAQVIPLVNSIKQLRNNANLTQNLSEDRGGWEHTLCSYHNPDVKPKKKNSESRDLSKILWNRMQQGISMIISQTNWVYPFECKLKHLKINLCNSIHQKYRREEESHMMIYINAEKCNNVKYPCIIKTWNSGNGRQLYLIKWIYETYSTNTILNGDMLKTDN